MILTHDDIEAMAHEKAETTQWGYKEYRRNEQGEWYLDHFLIVNHETKTSYREYFDGKPTEVIEWGKKWDNRILIDCPGDPSVGIMGVQVWINMPLLYDGEEHKEMVRELLKDSFDCIYDDNCHVYLSQDEMEKY